MVRLCLICPRTAKKLAQLFQLLLNGTVAGGLSMVQNTLNTLLPLLLLLLLLLLSRLLQLVYSNLLHIAHIKNLHI